MMILLHNILSAKRSLFKWMSTSFLLCFYITSVIANSDPQDANTLGKDKTLDVVTWNLQWFGAPYKSSNARTFEEQLTYVSDKILAMNADVYALQEVVSDKVNGYFLTELIEQLNTESSENKYWGIVSDRYSFSWNTPSNDFPSQCVCYIFNTNTVGVINRFAMFGDVYQDNSTQSIEGYDGTASTFWSSGRLPYFMEAIVSVDGKSEVVNFINIHAKAYSEDWKRREDDGDYLYNALISHYGDDNLIMLGDYNDETSSTNSPYNIWYANDNLHFLDVAGDGIDHISVSNELYPEFNSLLNNEYSEEVTISDHDPVMIRLLLDSEKELQSVTLSSVAEQQYGNKIQLSGASSSGLPVEYVVISDNAAIDGDMLEVTGYGTIVVQAVQKGDAQYAPAFSDAVYISVTKEDQTITFDPITTKTIGDDPFYISATATSGLSVSFEVVSGGVTLSGKKVTLEEVGEVVIKAMQEGNDQYNAAPEVTQTFMVEEENGIEEEYARQVGIFPNPTTGQITISAPDVTDKTIRFFDLSGKKVTEFNFFGNEKKFDLSALPNGLFFVQITSGSITITKKIQVRH
ncbi:T9SS type A sorting domain-containing protein [Saccharicrinis sp. 156]|uniref:T9SS type A sorting domain-containing protein n=1 Tax=Saccharicrinis sp. 156 TaxID=3417574 RepID=UPI003D35295C